MPSKKNVAVIGAGVGGLSTAARLAYRGHDVCVYEKLPECGGRAHMIDDHGFKFDTGPSFVLMPDFFEEVFSYCGKTLSNYLDLKFLDISYKIFYPGGETLTIHRDTQKTKAELERIEPGSSRSYDVFIQETAKIYTQVKPLLYRCFTKGNIFNPRYWSLLGSLRVFDTYWNLAKKFFKDERLCYAFTFEAMFIGVSPFETPAFYSVITYADHVQKIAHPMGGMYQIPKALERLAQSLGVKFQYNSAVHSIEHNNGVFGLTTEQGQVGADIVVVNADYAYSQQHLLKRSLPRYRYSCSTYLLYLGVKQKVKGLEHHNLFFSKDLRKNLRQIFSDHSVPDEPSFYIHVPTLTDPTLAPNGKDIVYVLVPVANLEKNNGSFTAHEAQLRKFIFETVRKTVGINLEDIIEVEHRFYPGDFIRRYNIHYGATFGLAHTLMQSAFFRPANNDPQFDNLYYVGASVQPGGGLPPVIASSKIVADMIEKKAGRGA